MKPDVEEEETGWFFMAMGGDLSYLLFSSTDYTIITVPKGGVMKQDRFLVGILIFVAVLMVISLALFFTRHQVPDYGSEDTPEGVVRNYILAIQKGDYPRAYSYLAEQEHKPSYTSFEQTFLSNPQGLNATGVRIGQTTQSGSQAWVEVTVAYSAGGPFGGRGWNNVEKASLIQQNGQWKITRLPYPYWGWEWYQKVEVAPSGD